MEVEIIEKEIRRMRRRIAPPEKLRFIDERGKCVTVSLHFLAPDCGSFREAFILDVGVGGFALSTSLELELGEETDLLARDAKRGSVLFEEHVRIVNERKAARDASGRTLHTYGLVTLAEEHSTLYKCILDSLFLDHVSGDEEDIHEMPFDPEHP